jgi:hypothetical protein
MPVFAVSLPFPVHHTARVWEKAKKEYQQQVSAAGIGLLCGLEALVQTLASEDTEYLAQQTLIVAFFIQVVNFDVIEGIAWIRLRLLIPVWRRTLFLPCLWLLHRS